MNSKPQTSQQQAEAHVLDRKIGLYSALVNLSRDLTQNEAELLYYLSMDRDVQEHITTVDLLVKKMEGK